jgi:hypothetical protein
VENPAIFATVKSGMPAGFEIANKADIGGQYSGEWIIGNTVWITELFNNQPSVYPRTGY